MKTETMKNKKQNPTITITRSVKSQQPLLRDTGNVLKVKTHLRAGTADRKATPILF